MYSPSHNRLKRLSRSASCAYKPPN